MKYNIMFTIEGIIIHFKKSNIWFLIIIFCFSCSAEKKTSIPKKEVVILNTLIFKDSKMLNLILNSIENFEKKYHKKSNVILLEYFVKGDKPTYELTNYSFLYNSYQDKEVLKYNFKGGAIINKTTVLLINNSEMENNSEFFILDNSKKELEIFYGKSTDMCQQKFTYIQNQFNLIESICSFDLIVE